MNAYNALAQNTHFSMAETDLIIHAKFHLPHRSRHPEQGPGWSVITLSAAFYRRKNWRSRTTKPYSKHFCGLPTPLWQPLLELAQSHRERQKRG